MKVRRLLPLMLIFLLFAAVVSAADGEESSFPLGGSVGIAGLYDSNLDIERDLSADQEAEGDFIYQLDLKFHLNYTFANRGHLNLNLQGLAYRPHHFPDESWYVGNGSLYADYPFGNNNISMLDSVRYYTAPEFAAVDLLRNEMTLAYKRKFSQLWEGLIGYENIADIHPDYHGLDYLMNGGFIEARNNWTPLAMTYYSFDFLYYLSNDDPVPMTLMGPPMEGYRYSAEVGFDTIFALRHNLHGSYTLQMDKGSFNDPDFKEVDNQQSEPGDRPEPISPSPNDRPDHRMPPPEPIDQFRGFEGEQFTLEIDAEFNYLKHIVSLLYSVGFHDRLTLSFFNEFIYKEYFPPDNAPPGIDTQWTDRLFLSSVWFTARMYKQFYGKAYYVYRVNWPLPSDEVEQFDKHVALIGVEFRF